MKVCVCCIASTENRYIREWCLHYKNLGVDNIYIYDNNPVDGEHFEDVINDLIEEGFVKLLNVRGINQWLFQYRVYEHFYANFGQLFDWICYFDIDEFLILKQDKNIKEYLSRECFENIENIHINWKVYDDNDLVNYEDEPVVERFTRSISDDVLLKYDFPENDTIKPIIKGKLDKVIKFEYTTHSPSTQLKCCNNVGNIIEDSKIYHHKHNSDLAQLNHYFTKTIEEYVNIKMKRGYPDQPLEEALKKMNIPLFFKINKMTKEKIDFLSTMNNQYE